MKRLLSIIFCLLLIPFALALAAENSPAISVKAEVNKAFITIGDPVIYTVSIRHDPKIKILSTIQPPGEDVFKIKKSESIDTKEGETILEGRRFTLTAFQLGDFILDPVEIQYLDISGEQKSLHTDKIFISVKSVAQGETKTDIRGVKSVVPLPSKILKILILGSGLFILTALILIIMNLRKKMVVPIHEPERLISAEDYALNQLTRLFESDLINRGKIKEYYLQLSEILKNYFEKRFQIPALEATTDEIIRALRKNEIELNLRTHIEEVLQASDLAKFAKWKPSPSEIIQINQKSKKIIELARPAESIPNV